MHETGPQSFGRPILGEWLLDPELTYLNHGTVGATPRVVLDAQEAIRREIEINPSAMILREITPLLGGSGGRLRAAAGEVADFLGARSEDVAFVGNATEAVNAVLRSRSLGSGDKLLITETTYGGVREAARYACRRSGAELVVAELPCPIGGPAQVLGAIERALLPGTRLAILDHIVSELGVVLPVRELAALCHERGVDVLIDGAHAPGQIPLDVPGLGADWYVGNLHKWAFAPRSCGVLWSAPGAREGLHPLTVSWNLDQGFAPEFDWTGTRDPSAYLAAPAGLAFLRRLGVEALREYNHSLVLRGAALLCERWGGQPLAPADMTAFMATVPLPSVLEASPESARGLRDRLLLEHRIEVPIFAWRDRLWSRLSVQVYNELDDFERLATALAALT